MRAIAAIAAVTSAVIDYFRTSFSLVRRDLDDRLRMVLRVPTKE